MKREKGKENLEQMTNRVENGARDGREQTEELEIHWKTGILLKMEAVASQLNLAVSIVFSSQ